MSDPKMLPRPCWFKTDREQPWERGTLHAWSTCADETGSEPVGVVEDQAGNIVDICLRYLSLRDTPSTA